MAGRRKRITIDVIPEDYRRLKAEQERSRETNPSKQSFSQLAHRQWFAQLPSLEQRKVRKKNNEDRPEAAA